MPLREPGFETHEGAHGLRASRLGLHACDLPPAEMAAATTATAASYSGSSSDEEASATAMLCTSRGVPVVRARAGEYELRRALGPLHRVKLLHLEQPRLSFGGFESDAAAAAFGERAGKLLGSWCCFQSSKKPHGKSQSKNRSPSSSLESGGGATATLRDVDTSKESHDALNGQGFKLRFRPRLGVLGEHGKRRARPSWRVTELVNNIFGRAELKKDTACCKYVGIATSLGECQTAAEKRPELSSRVSSVTWHRGLAGGAGGWAGTCYAITDGTWQPVPVEQGQAEADSARRGGGRPLPPAAELTTAWIFD